MKDIDPKVDPTIDMVEDRYGIMRQRVTFKTVHVCKHHPFATEKDIIDVVIKKTQKTVKRCRHCEDQKQKNKMEAKKVLEMEKANLTDYYLRKKLTRGSKLQMHDIPEPLIQVQRTAIQIERLKDKLEAPLKECSKHGKLYLDDVIKSGKSRTGAIQYKCRQCMKEMHKRHYEMNKILVKSKHKKYRDENKEKVALQKKRSWIKNKYKYLDQTTLVASHNRHAMLEAERKRNRKNMKSRDNSDELSDEYIKRLLTKRSDLKSEDIPQSMIECKRVLVQLKRGIQRKRDEDIYHYLEEDDQNGKD